MDNNRGPVGVAFFYDLRVGMFHQVIHVGDSQVEVVFDWEAMAGISKALRFVTDKAFIAEARIRQAIAKENMPREMAIAAAKEAELQGGMEPAMGVMWQAPPPKSGG